MAELDSDPTDAQSLNKIEVVVHQPLENKLTQISMGSLIIKMFVNNISWKFIVIIIINIILSSIIIPTLYKFSNDDIIRESNIQNGLLFILLAITFEILSIIHKNIFIQPNKEQFNTNVHCSLEQEINKNILLITWNNVRELNKNELENKKQMAKWAIKSLITNILNTFMSLFSFFGYSFWICYISPVSFCIYTFLMVFLLIFYPYKEKNKNESRQDIWDNYYNLQTGFYTDIIHHKGDNTLKEMEKCIEKLESCRYNDKKNDAMFTDTIDTIFNLGFIINCLLFVYLIPASDIIIYIQYTCLMRNSVSMFFSIHAQYKESKREYEKIVEIISKSKKRIKLEKKDFNNKITIESLKYIYPNDSNDANKPFSITLGDGQKLVFNKGQIIKLEGNSGSGKSSFVDILNGVIPFSEIESSIYLDDGHKIDGFDAITHLRYYIEQQESICWKPSIYEIISNKEIINKEDEEIVWQAITISSCLDFVKRENIEDERKWIHTKNIGMSGGQKGRIAIARATYRIITMKPKFITLDEVDRAIQSELVVAIMQNIYNYARENKILVFVICHNPDVKKLAEYDQTIRFDKGIITKITL